MLINFKIYKIKICSYEKILHLDIDGGYGGSSRSLYLLLESLLQTDIESEVWFKKPGPSLEKSKKIINL